MLAEDFQFSKDCLVLFIDQFGEQIGIVGYEDLSEIEDKRLCEDCLLHLKTGLSNHTSFRFRNFRYYDFQDITLRFIRPSGRTCDLAKINAKWFLYGVLSEDNKGFSRAIIIKWTNSFEEYLAKHPEILSEETQNKDGSSTFKSIKIRDIPPEFVVFSYDYLDQKATHSRSFTDFM